METIEFLVQGSSPSPYQVTFQKNGEHLAAFCTCAAGESGQACKHRLNILKALKEGIVSDNVHQVKVVASWLPGSNLELALKEVTRAEAELEVAKKAVSAAKRKVAAVMRANG